MIPRHPGLDVRRLRVLRRWLLGLPLVSLTFAGVTCALLQPTPAPRPSPPVTVLLDTGSDALEVRLDGAYEVHGPDGEVLAVGSRLAPGRFQVRGGTLVLNGLVLGAADVRLVPSGADRLTWSGHRYPGRFEVRQRSGGGLELLNLVDIEDYVAGVIFSEMPASFPREALKAQAIATRSFARWRMGQASPLRATEADQVYGGESDRAASARAIAESTRGQVLEFQGRPLPAYFSSTCGGATADAASVFGGEDLLPLRGRPCTWCRASPRYTWERDLDAAALARALDLRTAPPWSRITPVELDASGRCRRIRFEGAGGVEEVPATALRSRWNRQATADGNLPSAWLSALRPEGAVVHVSGRGFGHGVGLCQYGAAGLAAAGQDHRRILAYYYGGASLVRRW